MTSEPTTGVSIGAYLDFLAPRLRGPAPPSWPPDVFAVAASLFKRTGAYTRVAELRWPQTSPLLEADWPASAERVGRSWRSAFDSREPAAPAEVTTWWGVLHAAMDKRVADVEHDTPLVAALLKLVGAADEACQGVGVTRAVADRLLHRAEARLARNAWSSLCQHVPPDRVRVLPKQHAPQRGLTLRSLSHHLSLHPASDVRVAWRSPVDVAQDRDRLNLLLLPWPLDVQPQDFQVVLAHTNGPHLPAMPDRYRFFSYRRLARTQEPFDTRLRKALERAMGAAGQVDAVVLPELALTPEEYDQAEGVALEHGLLLVAGVEGPLRRNLASSEQAPQNVCAVQWGGPTAMRDSRTARGSDDVSAGAAHFTERTRVVQAKHHRWCLDRGQILQYGLGGVLPASRECWELTDIGERAVNFVTLGNWLTLSVLICEDLARQDPVADILRSVGPNLVIALLMDGPQLSSRWGARYASVLAEDPGSSVLTLTSLGMSRRSQPRAGSPSRAGVVGLWRDAKYGERELEMPAGCDAGVLSLTGESLDEFAADARPNRRARSTPASTRSRLALYDESRGGLTMQPQSSDLGLELSALVTLARVSQVSDDGQGDPDLQADLQEILNGLETPWAKTIGQAIVSPAAEPALNADQQHDLRLVRRLAGIESVEPAA